ncbi:MAG: FG-GAP-like repeat-containing protein, partial [Acidobacteriota bacterium]
VSGLFLFGQDNSPSDKNEIIISRFNSGIALMDQYRFESAIQEFHKLLEMDRGILPAWANLGISHFYGQEYEQALEAFKNALAIDPSEVHSHFVSGLIYINQDQVEKAVNSFRAVLKQDSQDVSANYYLGRLLMRSRQYEEALVYFETVIKNEPYNASAHYNRATALNRLRRTDESRKEMDRFRRLQDLFGSTTVGLQYLEQGKYAVAIQDLSADWLPGYIAPATSQISVTFRDVSSEAGLAFTHQGPGRADLGVTDKTYFENTIVPWLGSGVTFGDFDQDGYYDLYLANSGELGARGGLFRNLGNGAFEDVTESSGLVQKYKTSISLWGDYDNDGYPDLYLVNHGKNQLYHNEKDGTFKNVTELCGVGDDATGLGGAFVDYDHDSDLDIYIANFTDISGFDTTDKLFPGEFPGAENRLYQNDGKGVFKDVTEESGLGGGKHKTTAVLTGDFNNSRDTDFYLVNFREPDQLFSNKRDGSFELVSSLNGDRPATSASAGDLNGDGLLELLIPAGSPNRLEVLKGRDLSFNSEKDPHSLETSLNFVNVQLLDYDNDGDLDVLALNASLFLPAAKGPSISLFRNSGDSLEDVTAQVGLDSFSGLPLRGVSIADYDNDGDMDFAINVNGQAPLLLRNDGGNQNNWLAVKLDGSVSNKAGVGVKAEIRSGKHWQKIENMGGQGFLSQSPTRLHFGLGQHTSVDVVRLLWPNGILQSEKDHNVNNTIEIRELDRKGTSCPLMYVWDGNSYKFQTDFLGGSAYGNLLAPNTFNYPDTDEYIKLQRKDTKLKNVDLAITLNNQLEEVILFDQLELAVVDHPADYEVFPDEKLLPGPPYLPFRLLTAESVSAPVSASDGDGNDVLSSILKIDRLYPPVADSEPFKGYSNMHELVLDLGQVSQDYSVLLMYAWIDYADSSSNRAASQAGLHLTPPCLQVRDKNGTWVTVIENMGFPA